MIGIILLIQILISKALYFFNMSGVIATLFSKFYFQKLNQLSFYKRKIAIKISIITTAIEPQSTNFVKLFHVFYTIIIHYYFCLALNLGFFICNINSSSSSD